MKRKNYLYSSASILIGFEFKFGLSYTKFWNPTLSSNPDVQRAHRGQCRKCRIKLKIKFSASNLSDCFFLRTFAQMSLKILQLGKFYPVGGGVEKVMYDLVVGLSNRGIACDMLCAYDGKGRTEINVSPQNKVICTMTLLKKYATMISPEMMLRLRRIPSDYDIIHVHHPDPMSALSLWVSWDHGLLITQ